MTGVGVLLLLLWPVWPIGDTLSPERTLRVGIHFGSGVSSKLDTQLRGLTRRWVKDSVDAVGGYRLDKHMSVLPDPGTLEVIVTVNMGPVSRVAAHLHHWSLHAEVWYWTPRLKRTRIWTSGRVGGTALADHVVQHLGPQFRDLLQACLQGAALIDEWTLETRENNHAVDWGHVEASVHVPALEKGGL